MASVIPKVGITRSAAADGKRNGAVMRPLTGDRGNGSAGEQRRRIENGIGNGSRHTQRVDDDDAVNSCGYIGQVLSSAAVAPQIQVWRGSEVDEEVH